MSPGRSQGGPHGPGPPRAPLCWAVALPRGLARSAHSLLPAPTSALIQVNVRCAPTRAGAARCCPGRRVWDPRARRSCGRGDPAPPRRAPPPRLLPRARDLRFPFSQVVGRDHARSHRRQAWTRDWQGPLTHTHTQFLLSFRVPYPLASLRTVLPAFRLPFLLLPGEGSEFIATLSPRGSVCLASTGVSDSIQKSSPRVRPKPRESRFLALKSPRRLPPPQPGPRQAEGRGGIYKHSTCNKAFSFPELS